MQKSIIVLILVDAIAATIGIISAIGSTCPTFIPSDSEALSIMMEQQILFITTTTFSYVAAIGCIISIVGLFKGKDWFFNITLISGIFGLLMIILVLICLYILSRIAFFFALYSSGVT